VANVGGQACKVASTQSVAATTNGGALNLIGAGAGAADAQSATRHVTDLAPRTYTGFALGLSDYGDHCQYLRSFTLTLPHLATPVTVPITGLDGGAAVCGSDTASLEALADN
jgi:hypothetical protein